jgi:hypothetical protein
MPTYYHDYAFPMCSKKFIALLPYSGESEIPLKGNY